MPILVLLLLLLSSSLQAATSASVDLRKIKLTQNIQLNISSDNAAGAIPKLTILKRQFRILGSSMVSRPYLKNGKRAQKTIWYYVLQPKIAGKLTIPSININGEKTAPISIRVVASSHIKKSTSPVQKTKRDSSGIKIKATLDKDKVYPNQQLTYSVEIFYPERYKDLIRIKPPFIPGAISIAIGKPYAAPAQRSSVKGYLMKQQYAVFAEQVSRYQVSATAVLFRLSKQAQEQQLKAKKASFDIIPQANKTSLGYWLPSPKVTLTEHWQRPKTLYVGDTIEREVTLSALKLNSDILPLMSTLTDEKVTIKLQDISSENDSSSPLYTAIRKERISMTFKAPGMVILPPIDIHWWNTVKDHAQVSTLPAVNLYVQEKVAVIKEAVIDRNQSIKPALNIKAETITVDKNESESKDIQTWIIAILAALLVLTSCGWLLSLSKKSFKL